MNLATARNFFEIIIRSCQGRIAHSRFQKMTITISSSIPTNTRVVICQNLGKDIWGVRCYSTAEFLYGLHAEILIGFLGTYSGQGISDEMNRGLWVRALGTVEVKNDLILQE